MWAYVVRRLWQMIPTMFGVVLLVFILFNLFADLVYGWLDPRVRG